VSDVHYDHVEHHLTPIYGTTDLFLFHLKNKLHVRVCKVLAPVPTGIFRHAAGDEWHQIHKLRKPCGFLAWPQTH